MKPTLSALIVAASVFVSGCGSLDNPFPNLFRSGRDARVFNAQTGDFEWPEDSASPRRAAPAAARKTDGRYFDVARNQWVEAPQETAPTPPSKSRGPAPAPAASPEVAAPTPPPAPPERASGIYNPSTGEIEWRSYDPASAPATPPAPRKKWWWPF